MDSVSQKPFTPLSKEIEFHIDDAEWLRKLVQNYLTSEIRPIIKSYHFFHSDLEEGPSDDTTEYYPEKRTPTLLGSSRSRMGKELARGF
jgi:hypothetical protein